MDIHSEKVLILDFGSQYTQLIARRIREAKVYCEIHPYNRSLAFIKSFKASGIILSGGPSSVFDKGAPVVPKGIFSLGVPILGICYGMQLTAKLLGGVVEKSEKREYGGASLTIDSKGDLFRGIKHRSIKVWMSHGDRIERLPRAFTSIAHSSNSKFSAMRHLARRIYGVQFHPEVAHTPAGRTIIENFLFRVCKLKPTWTMESFIETAVSDIRKRVGSSKVVCGISGGVDSSVAALLVHRAVGDNLTCIFVDNGVLRKGEFARVSAMLRRNFHMSIRCVDASSRFLKKLKGVNDPERKRKIIGNEFIRVFEAEARSIKNVKFLAQGTLYPDVIESVSFKGPSATIKSHHNVGGLLKKMKLKLVEGAEAARHTDVAHGVLYEHDLAREEIPEA